MCNENTTIYIILSKCTDLFQFVKYCESNGYHHGGGCSVRDPHGYKGSHSTKASEQLCVAAPKRLHYNQSNPQMQIAVFGGNSEYQAANKDHDGIIHVTGACLLSTKDTK